MLLFVRHTMQNPFALGFLSYILVCVPVVGMWAVHKYNWQHWEPFAKK